MEKLRTSTDASKQSNCWCKFLLPNISFINSAYISVSAKFLLPDLSIIKSPYFLIDGKFVSSKKAAGIYEPFGQFDEGIGPDILYGVCSTDKYSLLDLGVGFNLYLYKQPISVDVLITNVTDEVYRDFLDTYKGYALSPGRSVNVKLNVPF